MNKIFIRAFSLIIGTFPAYSSDAQISFEPLNDAQIAGVVRALNDSEIEMAALIPCPEDEENRLCESERSVVDHSMVNLEILNWTEETGVEPEDSSLSEDLKKHSQHWVGILEDLEGNALSAQFIQSTTEFHQIAIDLLDYVLLPQVQDAALRAILEKFRSKLSEPHSAVNAFFSPTSI